MLPGLWSHFLAFGLDSDVSNLTSKQPVVDEGASTRPEVSGHSLTVKCNEVSADSVAEL